MLAVILYQGKFT